MTESPPAQFVRRISWIKRGIRIFWMTGLLVFLVAAYFHWATQRTPEFYRKVLAEQPDPEMREQFANQANQKLEQIELAILEQRPTTATFSQFEVNSWIQRELVENPASVWPREISEPRILFEEGFVRLAVRIHQPGWKGVLSIQATVRIREETILEIHLQNISAGSIPIPLSTAKERLASLLKGIRWPITWRTRNDQHFLEIPLENGSIPGPSLRAIRLQKGAVEIEFQPLPRSVSAG